MKNIKTKKGAALLTVLLLISFISILIFGISRQTISEMALNRGNNDSIGAYYAAEAGLQDGLLRFKLNRDYATTTPDTVNLGAKAKYNLTMAWQTAKNPPEQTGNIVSTGKILKDQPMELVVSYDSANNSSQTVTFNINCAVLDKSGVQIASEKADSVEILEINASGGITSRFVKKCPIDLATDISKNVTLLGVAKVRINAFFNDPASDPDAHLKYTVTFPKSIQIDSGYTTITSTGIIGDNVRKLELKIDRTTGKAVGFLDYALYSAGANPIK